MIENDHYYLMFIMDEYKKMILFSYINDYIREILCNNFDSPEEISIYGSGYDLSRTTAEGRVYFQLSNEDWCSGEIELDIRDPYEYHPRDGLHICRQLLKQPEESKHPEN